MDIVLHIGVEKTGTSSIQRFLTANFGRLVSNGILYPRDLCLENQLCLPACAIGLPDYDEVTKQAYHFIARSNYSNMVKYVQDTLAAQIREYNPKILVLSNEHLHSRVREVRHMRALLSALRPLSSTIKIIAYIRRQDKLALSLYSTRLKYGKAFMGSPLALVGAETPYYFDFKKVLSAWKEALGGGELAVRVFNRAELSGGDVVRDFFGTLGFSVGFPVKGVPINESIIGEAQFFLSAINRALLLNHTSARDAAAVRRDVVDFLETYYGGAGISVTRREAETFVAAFRASNAYVLEKFLPGRPELFDSNFDEYEEDYVFVPEVRKLAELAARFVVRHQARGASPPSALSGEDAGGAG